MLECGSVARVARVFLKIIAWCGVQHTGTRACPCGSVWPTRTDPTGVVDLPNCLKKKSAAMEPSAPPTSSDVELPKHHGPRPGALMLLTPEQRGLTLAIIQADRCGRGGEDLEILSGNFDSDNDAAAQLNMRIAMTSAWEKPPPKPSPKKR